MPAYERNVRASSWTLTNLRLPCLTEFFRWMLKPPSPILLSCSLATLAIITIAVTSELAFVTNVKISSGDATGKAIWVSLPLDNSSDGPFLIPIDRFKSTTVDRLLMPLLFALMVMVASASVLLV